MEKFGIFELLDTLSAIVDGEKGAPAAPSSDLPDGVPAEAPAEAEGKAAPSVEDRAFLPPDYAGGESSAALSSFLSKHDELARRAAKKK